MSLQLNHKQTDQVIRNGEEDSADLNGFRLEHSDSTFSLVVKYIKRIKIVQKKHFRQKANCIQNEFI